MNHEYVTAVEMAREAGIDPKTYRKALRAEGLWWHMEFDRWTAPRGSSNHDDMRRVLSALQGRNA